MNRLHYTKGKKQIIAERLLAINIVSFIAGLILGMMIHFLRFPEMYVTTWKYQLENDIKRGNEQAIEYYNERYLLNNKKLFE